VKRLKIQEIAEHIGGKIEYLPEGFDRDIKYAGASDLISDVLAFVKKPPLLLTGLISLQMVRTASLLDLPGIVFVRGKKPTKEVLEFAKECHIPILTTDRMLYTTCATLYNAGLRATNGEDSNSL